MEGQISRLARTDATTLRIQLASYTANLQSHALDPITHAINPAALQSRRASDTSRHHMI
jgi:hypothetical protein